jgi:hypothetical protein
MNKLTASTAVLAFLWATSAQAQMGDSNPAPEQAPLPYGQPAPAPGPGAYTPPAQYSPAPAPAPYPYSSAANNEAAPAQAERTPGVHAAIGLGLAGVGPQGRPGFATQFKLGGRLSPEFTLYYYALNHWYPSYPGFNKHWRIAAVNGVGVDYFVVPKLGGRFGIGLGGDMPEDFSNSASKPRYLGYSYFMGLTWEIFDSRSHLSIDPVINVLQLSENSVWRSYVSFLLTLNWVYN